MTGVNLAFYIDRARVGLIIGVPGWVFRARNSGMNFAVTIYASRGREGVESAPTGRVAVTDLLRGEACLRT